MVEPGFRSRKDCDCDVDEGMERYGLACRTSIYRRLTKKNQRGKEGLAGQYFVGLSSLSRTRLENENEWSFCTHWNGKNRSLGFKFTQSIHITNALNAEIKALPSQTSTSISNSVFDRLSSASCT